MAQLQVFLSDVGQVTHDLTEDKHTVGRLADNTLYIEDPSVSSRHAEITFEGGVYHLHDLGSTNGTFVNEEKVTDAVLSHGDEIRFGTIPVVFAGDETNVVSQPLPESAGVTTEAAASSSRPANFVSSSPVPRNTKTGDPLGLAAYALAGIAFAAFLTAIALVYALGTPA